jgi:adenylylsulfate kinase
MSGVVVWLTGLPSSGKSTLAARVAEQLRATHPRSCVLDSDDVRAVLVPKPGYDPMARDRFYATLANLAALLARQGLIVLVPSTAHLRRYRDNARRLWPRFVEVYVDATRDEVEERDAKGLFAGVRDGRISGVPGADLEYEPPLEPNVVAGGGEDPEAPDRVVAAVQACLQQTGAKQA